MFRKRLRLLSVILYVALIFSLSSIPSLTAPGIEFVPADKIAHTVEYFVFGILLFNAVGRSVAPSRAASFALLFALGVTVAALDEFYQSLVPGRMMSIYDWFADAIGLGLGVGIFVFGAKPTGLPARDGSGNQN